MPNMSVNNIRLEYDYYPDICPICHHAIEPKYLTAILTGQPDNKNTYLHIAFQCTYRDCSKMFIGIYKRISFNAQGKAVGSFYFQKAVPQSYTKPIIPDEIIELSLSFVKIFEQSKAAESFNLDEITGVGYRKALEFLIKDYCIYKNKEKENEIKTSFLGKVINEYVDDVNIKACAKRAVWLGNDETHYVKKWEEKDLKDLKILIELTIGWIRNNLLTEKYMQDMSDPSA